MVELKEIFLDGHQGEVKCLLFADDHGNDGLLLSASTDGKIKVWDLQAAMDPRAPAGTLCIRTLVEHSGRVFR